MSKNKTGINLSYIDRPSFIHGLTGTTKLICLLLWSVILMLSFDTRILFSMLFLSITFFIVSKIKIREVIVLLTMILLLLLLNLVISYIFAPEQGVEVYGSRTIIFTITKRFVITKEQLFYMLNMALKYFVMSPIAILFLLTTEPTEFAASLYSVGISYKISYAVSLALRYIPDIQKDFTTISKSQQARGVALSSREPILDRIKNVAAILTPLILSNLSKIQDVSDAMELRNFGKHSKRTWYNGRKAKKGDFFTLAFMLIFTIISIIVTYQGGNRYYNPFV